jgi:DNA repair protein RadC
MIRKVSLVKVWTVMEEAETLKLDSPELAVQFWRANVEPMPIFDANKEHAAVLLLNTRFHIKSWNLVSVGSVNESIVHPREVFRAAIVAGSYALILMHNHPSGDPAPSQPDHALTRRLAEAAEFLQIKVLDHVIVGDGSRYFSFKEAGVL